MENGILSLSAELGTRHKCCDNVLWPTNYTLSIYILYSIRSTNSVLGIGIGIIYSSTEFYEQYVKIIIDSG